MATTAEVSAEVDNPEVSTMTTDASIEEAEDTTRLSEHLQPKRRRCVYELRVLATITAALGE